MRSLAPAKFIELGYELLPHSLDSRAVAPSDYFQFPSARWTQIWLQGGNPRSNQSLFWETWHIRSVGMGGKIGQTLDGSVCNSKKTMLTNKTWIVDNTILLKKSWTRYKIFLENVNMKEKKLFNGNGRWNKYNLPQNYDGWW